MSDKIILNAVESAENDFREAERKFNNAASDIKRKAARAPISLALTVEEEMYNLQNQLNYNAKIVEEFASITADYWAACEALILSLDAICRPLLNENPSALVVGEVSRFISKVIEDVSNLKVDFTVSLNSSNLGDVGSLNPKASVAVQTIERLWKEAYKGHPDYAEDAKRIKDQKDAEEKRINERKKALKDELNKAIAREKELISTAASVNEKREIIIDEGNNRILDFEQKLFTEASHLKTLMIDAEKEKLQSELECANQKLKTIGFFDFSNKKVLKARIASFNNYLKNPTTSPDIAQQLSDIDKTVNNALKQYKDAVNTYISTRFKIDEIRYDFGSTPYAEHEFNYELMMNILTFLASQKGPRNVEDIVANIACESNQKVSYLARQLHSQGFLVRSSDSDWKTCYGISPDIKVTKVKVWKENKEEAKKGIPCPPVDIKKLFK